MYLKTKEKQIFLRTLISETYLDICDQINTFGGDLFLLKDYIFVKEYSLDKCSETDECNIEYECISENSLFPTKVKVLNSTIPCIDIDELHQKRFMGRSISVEFKNLRIRVYLNLASETIETEFVADSAELV